MGRIYDKRREEAIGRDAVGDDYEIQIKKEYERKGYHVDQYKVGRIVDLKVENASEIILIQCKNWRKPVRMDIDDIKGLVEHREYLKDFHKKRTKAVIVYSSTLSEETKDYAKRYHVKTEQIDYRPSREEIMREMGVGMKQHTQEGLDAMGTVGDGAQGWFRGRFFARKTRRHK
jgi:hypothetical protein